MKWWRIMLAAGLVGSSAVFAMGCDGQEEPQPGDAIRQLGEDLEDASDKLGDAVDEAADELKDAAEDVEDEIEEANP